MNMINPVANGSNTSIAAQHASVPANGPSASVPNNSVADEQSNSEHEVQQSTRSADVELHLPDNEIVLAGPSPAFEASLLELEADIDNVIRRVHADRERARNGEAISTKPAQSTLPETEPAAATQAAAIESTQPNPYDNRTEPNPTES